MALLFLAALCRSCIASKSTEASCRIGELAEELRQHVLNVQNFQVDDITISTQGEEDLDRILALSEAVKADISKSLVFWEKMDRREASDGEAPDELKRLSDLLELLERIRVCMDLNTYLGEEEKDVCDAALGNIADCREWLQLHKGKCAKHMDFQMAQEALACYMDYTKFFYRCLALFVHISKLFSESQDSCETEDLGEDTFLESSKQFHNEYRCMLYYLENCSLKKYVLLGKEKKSRLFGRLVGLIERCDAIKAQLDELMSGVVQNGERIAESQAEKARSLHAVLDAVCEQAQEELERDVAQFENSHVVVDMLIFADFCVYAIHLEKLQRASDLHKRALVQKRQEQCCLL